VTTEAACPTCGTRSPVGSAHTEDCPRAQPDTPRTADAASCHIDPCSSLLCPCYREALADYADGTSTQPGTPRTADADDLANAVWACRSRGDFVDPSWGDVADRLEASARLRPLEDAVLNAALDEFDISNPDLNDVDTYEVLWAAVRALKDAREGT
jgi:hypothetical protein